MGKNWQKYQFFGQTYEKTIRGWGLIQKKCHFHQMYGIRFRPHGGLFEGGGLFAKRKFYMGAYSRVGAKSRTYGI